MNEDYLSDPSSCSTSWCRFIPLLRFAINTDVFIYSGILHAPS